jgi:hypothetical protein
LAQAGLCFRRKQTMLPAGTRSSFLRGKPAPEIIAQLYSAMVKFPASTPQLDDLTALVLKRL